MHRKREPFQAEKGFRKAAAEGSFRVGMPNLSACIRFYQDVRTG